MERSRIRFIRHMLKMNIVENEKPRSSSSVSDKTELSTRDTTKYSIDGGEPLKKRRFVLAVVKRYVETHPDITYEELRQIFPDRLSHSSTYGVFRPYNDIFEKLYDQPDLRKRFFLEKDDLIELSDGTLLTVYNQWGPHFPYFLEVAKQLHNVESFSNDGWQNVERDG